MKINEKLLIFYYKNQKIVVSLLAFAFWYILETSLIEQHKKSFRRRKYMPKTKFENIVFTLFMSFLMVYAMICYNIALNMGGMSNQVFLLAFHELVIMWPVAFILEYFFVDKLAHYFAFKVVTPKDRPFFITLAISFYIICIMCPIMSLIATILFKTPGIQIISVWFMTILFNFPMAFFWQICYCGPTIRWLFGKLFN